MFSSSGSVGTLTLADLESIAVRHNPTLAAAAARIDAARGMQLQAGLYPNPVFGYHGMEMANQGTAGQQGAFISQRFITGGKRMIDRAVAAQRVRESLFRWDIQQRRVLTDVRVRFYGALVAQERVRLTTQLVDIGDDLVRSSRRLLDARQVSENDLLQAEIEAEQAKILLDNARHETAEQWRRLAAVIGWPRLEPAPLAENLEGALPRFDWHEVHDSLLEASPELGEARARVRTARLALERTAREPIPDVNLSVAVRHHNVTEDQVADVQLGIPIPIFDKNQGNIRAARAELAASVDDVRRLELDLQDRLAVAFRRYASALEQVERYRNVILPRALRSLDLVTRGYQEGQTEYLALITSQRTFVQVSLSYLEAMSEFREAESVIDGQLLSGSLAERP